ncbi:hypothetical protein CSKR_105523 [Clonorchis sinensis]|uniref:Uncharacterized protein n=1 Tax=Clonorchis sinensis TaxID=79923 RepID=A0A3R7D4N0_CLOSI|nr:hypothetical protein CSKR_105523 [Clonorchis sinensis]
MSNTSVPNEYEIVRVAELFWICRTKLKLNGTGDSCEVHEKFTRTLYRNTNNARFAEACVSGSSMFKVLLAKLLTVSYRSSMGNGPSALVPDTDPCVDGLLELLTVEVAENVMVNRTFGTRKTQRCNEEGLRCGIAYLRTPTEQLQTTEQGSKTLICISFIKLNIHLLLERVFLNFFWIFIDCY